MEKAERKRHGRIRELTHKIRNEHYGFLRGLRLDECKETTRRGYLEEAFRGHAIYTYLLQENPDDKRIPPRQKMLKNLLENLDRNRHRRKTGDRERILGEVKNDSVYKGLMMVIDVFYNVAGEEYADWDEDDRRQHLELLEEPLILMKRSMERRTMGEKLYHALEKKLTGEGRTDTLAIKPFIENYLRMGYQTDYNKVVKNIISQAA